MLLDLRKKMELVLGSVKFLNTPYLAILGDGLSHLKTSKIKCDFHQSVEKNCPSV